jgi:hypothetical protein
MACVEIEADYSRMIINPTEKSNYDEYVKLMADYLQITDKMIAAAKAGNQTEAVNLLRTSSSKQIPDCAITSIRW